MERYVLNSADTFFLTFLGAWISARSQLWNDPMSIGIMIFAILVFSKLVIEIRYFIRDKETSKLTFIFTFLAISICYFLWKEPNFIPKGDYSILITMFIMWIMNPITEFFDLFQIRFIVKEKKKKQTA